MFTPSCLYFVALQLHKFTKPRALHAPEGEQYILLAPTASSTGGLSVTDWKGFSGSLRYRYLANRPASEDNKALAEGYFLTDLSLDYQSKHVGAGFTIENLFNTAGEKRSSSQNRAGNTNKRR